ncbi:hypothetical protein [Paenibacillus ginsengarvi]|uniref:Uncharacterized protein n=1 Tax=Paenibacillus ginsengarvi TaxID=400777 RepID=A0A3B0BZ53_9BACL|nr:hypothetical protein [Paenibacillus ginsengarvi]RKN77167.1 hypothetical protein D7M11_24420 [Paenibacillus ginsengarvi]
MDVIVFLSVSMWEWFALILLIFALYRFEIGHHLGQLAFSGFLLAMCSYMLFIVFEFNLIALLVQPIAAFLFFWLMFKIPPLYASIIVINGYLAYCLVMSTLYLVTEQFGAVITPSTSTNYAFHAMTGLILLLLTWFVVRFRLGFSFVHYGDTGFTAPSLPGLHKKLLPLVTALGCLMLAGFNLIYWRTGYTPLFVVLTALSLGLLGYYAFRMEHEIASARRNKRIG